MAYPPGHYYSPLVTPDRARHGGGLARASAERIEGIDLRSESQLDLVDRLREHAVRQPFTETKTGRNRYFFENPFFSYGDAVVLHCMLLHLRPRRVVEVGSGFSSAVILDTNEQFLDPPASITLIEPHPERLQAVVGAVEATQARLLASRVQDVDVAVFEDLAADDVLFVDSSHVVKAGSDVQLLLLHILPRLQPGVVIHLHDVFYPFEYPPDWIERGLSWNELYVLQAFLCFNTEFEILLFNSYLADRHRDAVAEALPPWGRDPGSSIWLRRRWSP